MLFEIDENGAIKEKHKAVDPFSAKDTPFLEPSTADPFIINKGKVYFTCGLSKPQKNYTHYGMVMVMTFLPRNRSLSSLYQMNTMMFSGELHLNTWQISPTIPPKRTLS